MSGSGGFYKYMCKYFYTHNCPNWVWVNYAACASCLAEGREEGLNQHLNFPPRGAIQSIQDSCCTPPESLTQRWVWYDGGFNFVQTVRLSSQASNKRVDLGKESTASQDDI
ncbi:hypothetical protein QBC46DRAFT_410893 [Diplogelasinospora grovesii]|uniref:Uncharacterized protein n=1 Tax=Diplogelasinospora grovesii TaxID=303347 RepID=A0AAN6N3S7_9PEZI|nr:hypothetical protein QBC46DRAFT_410893 [Diplogelasinospora grovesii]